MFNKGEYYLSDTYPSVLKEVEASLNQAGTLAHYFQEANDEEGVMLSMAIIKHIIAKVEKALSDDASVRKEISESMEDR